MSATAKRISERMREGVKQRRGAAVLSGMVGVYFLNGIGLVNLHIKPTLVGANLLGGAIFGSGCFFSIFARARAPAPSARAGWTACFGGCLLGVNPWIVIVPLFVFAGGFLVWLDRKGL